MRSWMGLVEIGLAKRYPRYSRHSAGDSLAGLPKLSVGLERAAWVAFLLVIMSRALSPNIIGILNNDSIHYLDRAASPGEYGLVFQGFRQAGYPLFLGVLDVVAEVTPYDLFFLTAVIQRTLLIGALAYFAYLLRWWAAPALVFLSMPTLVTTTDLMLTEALSLPLAILLAGLLIHASGLARVPVGPSQRLGLLAGAGATLLLLVLVKFQYAAMALPLAGVVFTLWRSSAITRRVAVLAVGLPGVLIVSLAIGQSIENKNENGVFLPVSEQARVAWYSAYKSVFGMESSPSRQLAPYYDGGDLYVFLHDLERREPDYFVRRDVINERIADLLRAAGVTSRQLQWNAFVDFMQLGQSDDLQSLVAFIRTKSPDEVEGLNGRNYFSAANGIQQLYVTYNDGQTPSSLPTSNLAVAIGPDDYRSARMWVLPLAILTLIASMGMIEVRWFAAGTLLMVVSVAAAHAYYYTSNSRYTLPSAAFALVAASMAASTFGRRLCSEGERPRWDGTRRGRQSSFDLVPGQPNSVE